MLKLKKRGGRFSAFPTFLFFIYFYNIAWDWGWGDEGGEGKGLKFCKTYIYCLNIPHLPSKSLEFLVPGPWGQGRC